MTSYPSLGPGSKRTLPQPEGTSDSIMGLNTLNAKGHHSGPRLLNLGEPRATIIIVSQDLYAVLIFNAGPFSYFTDNFLELYIIGNLMLQNSQCTVTVVFNLL